MLLKICNIAKKNLRTCVLALNYNLNACNDCQIWWTAPIGNDLINSSSGNVRRMTFYARSHKKLRLPKSSLLLLWKKPLNFFLMRHLIDKPLDYRFQRSNPDVMSWLRCFLCKHECILRGETSGLYLQCRRKFDLISFYQCFRFAVIEFSRWKPHADNEVIVKACYHLSFSWKHLLCQQISTFGLKRTLKTNFELIDH